MPRDLAGDRMTAYEKVRSGRTTSRSGRGLCESCNQRRTLGSPKANDVWPSHLQLSHTQVDLLLIAAAEFEDLSEEAGTISNAIDFVDWIRPSVVKAA